MLTTLMLTLSLSAAAPAAAPQKAPDFTGTWIEDEAARKITPPPAPAPAGMPVLTGPPPSLIVTHTPQMLRTDRPWQHGVVTHNYKLDGGESANRNGANTLTTKSRWDGAKLVTEGSSYSVTSQGESTWRFKEIRWIDAKGSMVMETTNIDEAGVAHVVLRVFRKK
ncbi:MAG: hypothetical protein M3R55_07120 [Acidobacteriota bacterium]|nr:hypothetical protein [Acidobacteriota bacterium]